MNESSNILRPLRSQPISAAQSTRKALTIVVGIGVLGVLSACGGVSNLAEERVAQSETSVQQAQQTLGQSEHGAVELQQAKEQLSAAKSAVENGRQQDAERAAAQAHLYAQLAVAKSQSAIARKSADEVLASVESLRQETERTEPQR